LDEKREEKDGVGDIGDKGRNGED
jgi:hypothetical protein